MENKNVVLKHLNLERNLIIPYAYKPGPLSLYTESLWYSPKHNCFGIFSLPVGHGYGIARFETEFKSGPVTGAPQIWGTKNNPWILIGRCE